ncbi:MAG: Chemotaxis response regulator protein-glutamate methylesterase [Anaerolineae bacterium]|nr:Chemotaxis response regulator protein-glutamate methylesterase [Anaerolineae bacterium]
MNKLRALVIDDSRQVRDFLIEYVLEPNGFEVDIAVDGLQGLHKAVNTLPDVILMDYEMPRMTGLEVLRSLRHKHQNKTPVILMTSHGSEEIAVEVFRLGVHDYIMKPFDPKTMLAAIENALSVTRLQREKEALTRRIMQANQQLTQRLEEFNTLNEVGKSITALMNPNQLLERIIDAVLMVTRSEECTLVLVDSGTGRVKKQLTRQRAGEHDRPGHTKLLNTGALAGGNGKTIEKISETVLSVPIQVGKKAFGTLSIRKDVGSKFTYHDNRLLGMLADYAAIAIQNMQLVRQIQTTKEREKQQIRGLFERYVAPSVVHQMLNEPGRVSLGGVRQTCTILFADVRGFSAFSSRISPEILIELLNQYLRVAADAIAAREGTLDKFMGDAVMAFFNAPLPQSDHPIRAVRAAWAMSRAVKELHRRLPPQYHLDFGIGVGIGDAVVGNVGTPQMMNYTVIGDAVNRVKRLQENAKGGQILISQITYHMVQEYIEARSLGDIQLKGQSYPEMIYEVLNVED